MIHTYVQPTYAHLRTGEAYQWYYNMRSRDVEERITHGLLIIMVTLRCFKLPCDHSSLPPLDSDFPYVFHPVRLHSQHPGIGMGDKAGELLASLVDLLPHMLA